MRSCLRREARNLTFGLTFWSGIGYSIEIGYQYGKYVHTSQTTVHSIIYCNVYRRCMY